MVSSGLKSHNKAGKFVSGSGEMWEWDRKIYLFNLLGHQNLDSTG